MPSPLPPTSKKKFWNPDGQAEQESVDISTLHINKASGHMVVSKNGLAVCTSCDNPHTIPFDHKRFEIFDGKIVRKETLPLTKSGTHPHNQV